MKIFKRPIIFLLGLLLFVLPTIQGQSEVLPAKAGFSAERLSRLAGFLEDEITKERIPGAVVKIFRKGALAHFESYGYTNIEARTPLQKDQIFYIQSMTKPIVSVAFMMLYEEGHFELADPVSKYLPEFKDVEVAVYEDGEMDSKVVNAKKVTQEITMTHLLTHTAGFSHGLGRSDIDQQYGMALYRDNNHKTIADRVGVLTELPLLAEPGEMWYYSASPDILALLIEKFSGMSTAEFLQEKIFDPLEMKDTGYNIREEAKLRAPGLHVVNENKLLHSPRQTPVSGNTIFGGTHGLFSTASDYMNFCQMLLNEGEYQGKRLLSRKTVELMTVNHVGDLYPEDGFGFGLGFCVKTDLADSESLGSVGHYFWNGAYNTYFIIDPQEEMIAVMMTQFAPYTDYYRRKFKHFVYQAIAD